MLKTAICPVGNHEFTYETGRGQGGRVFCGPVHRRKARYDKALTEDEERVRASQQRGSKRQAARKRAAGAVPRRCSRCKQTKDADQFPGPTAPYCRPCWADYSRERRALNSDRIPLYTRMGTLRRYGLTPESFDALLASQDGKCAICSTSEPGATGVWHVDHDHTCCSTRKVSCGKCVRGLLCTHCNIGVGNFADSPERLRAAADYLEAHAARRAAHPAAPAV